MRFEDVLRASARAARVVMKRSGPGSGHEPPGRAAPPRELGRRRCHGQCADLPPLQPTPVLSTALIDCAIARLARERGGGGGGGGERASERARERERERERESERE
jgi:hypothetical protein